MDSNPENLRRRAAGWIGIPSISLWGALRTLEWLFSLGGASGNAEGWRKAGSVMLSAMPPWLMPALFVGGGVALAIYLVGVVPELYDKSRHRILTLMATPDGIKRLSTVISIAVGVVTAALVVGLIYYLVSTHERTKTVWTHPTLSAADQERAKAKCRMAAYDAIGAGRGDLKDPTPAARRIYVSNCLTSKGLVSKEVKR